MKLDFLYQSMVGRLLIQIIQKMGMFRWGAWFLKQPLSRCMIPGYIKKNEIDMSNFEEKKYHSFADFFAREKKSFSYMITSEVLISPCDGMLSVYPITEILTLPMKNSWYRLKDIVPDNRLAKEFKDGLCLVFRLRAKDYHHFCAFDDGKVVERHFIPGQLHSVQPIACENVPVYRLNRRWWSVLETNNFGKVLQIEIGAMMVGGVRYHTEEQFEKGMKMGNFELAGSTIILLLNNSVRKGLRFYDEIEKTIDKNCEIPVTMGMGIGILL